MGRYLVLWEVDQSKIPIDPKERATGWAFLMSMIRKDREKGITKIAMKTQFKLLCVLILVFFCLFGCATTRSYVDPGYGRATYDDIIRRSAPYRVKIFVEFQRNGEHLPQADSELMGHVERVVRGTGFAIPATQDISGELKVVVNNIADLGKAAAKGFGTGLTFGLAESTITDNYEMEASLYK